jgi:hypothetical protein
VINSKTGIRMTNDSIAIPVKSEATQQITARD